MKRYSESFKSKVRTFIADHGAYRAAKKFGIAQKTAREWRRGASQVVTGGKGEVIQVQVAPKCACRFESENRDLKDLVIRLLIAAQHK